MNVCVCLSLLFFFSFYLLFPSLLLNLLLSSSSFPLAFSFYLFFLSVNYFPSLSLFRLTPSLSFPSSSSSSLVHSLALLEQQLAHSWSEACWECSHPHLRVKGDGSDERGRKEAPSMSDSSFWFHIYLQYVWCCTQCCVVGGGRSFHIFYWRKSSNTTAVQVNK